MFYLWKRICKFCGVSFDIGRIRCAGEPEEAAWDPRGSAFVEEQGYFEGLCQHNFDRTVTAAVDVERWKARAGKQGEHIADLDCICLRGYSGHQISLAEMKGCRAVQYLVPKDVDWRPESDDGAFETDGNSFLFGISDGATPRTPLENSYPVRHGIPGINIEYYAGYPNNIYKVEISADRRRLRRTWKNGVFLSILHASRYTEKAPEPALGKLTLRVCSRGTSPCYNRDDIFGDRIVMNASESEVCWRHEPGREYLVANPIKIPGLQQLLEPPESCASKRDAFGSSDGLDDLQVEDIPTPSSIRTATRDIFTVLPAEITSIILDCLGPKDIANLRLATPVFRQLPTTLFKRLFREEMPLLYEWAEQDMARVDWYELYCRCNTGQRNRERMLRAVEEMMDKIQKFGNLSEL